MIELLAPAGNFEKLEIALCYGADAVYFSGKSFGLRAFAGNFSDEEITKACELCHKKSKKAYVTLNILARDGDFNKTLNDYLKVLSLAKVDGVIVSDLGMIEYIRKQQPDLCVHVSTQANVTNSQTANFLAGMGVKRIVLARELSLDEIANIKKQLPKDVEIECFVHGAMCVSYSGRCLLSNFLCGRESNRGECAQPCRWNYTISEFGKNGENFPIEQDERGTYILNSKDLCMAEYVQDLKNAGISSLKIEGRMKSQYYVATVTNAYRRAIDDLEGDRSIDYLAELQKTSHRKFTTGFYYPENTDNIFNKSSATVQSYDFVAMAVGDFDGEKTLFEMRNKFGVGEQLEILSPGKLFDKQIKITKITNEQGEMLEEVKNVQQKVYIYSNEPFKKFDILRKKNEIL